MKTKKITKNKKDKETNTSKTPATNKFLKFINDKEKLIKEYIFYAGFIILILMIFVAILLNANIGYNHENDSNKLNYSWIIFGAIFGFVSLVSYIPIGIYFGVQLYYEIINRNFKQKFYELVFMQVFNAYCILTIIIFSIINYQLFFTNTILYVFVELLILKEHYFKNGNFPIKNIMNKIKFKKGKTTNSINEN